MKTEGLFSEKKKCCGCGVCVSVCPKNAICLVEDENGFLYPEINEKNVLVVKNVKIIVLFRSM